MRAGFSFLSLLCLAIVFAESGVIASHLPQTWWFLGPFVTAGVAVILVLGLKFAPDDPIIRALRRLAGAIRSKTRRGLAS